MMGQARDERDTRETVGSIRGDECTRFAQANVLVSRSVRPSRLTLHVLRSVMAIDPICGMTVDPATAVGSHDHRGQRYYFCGLSCLERFKADPELALQPQPVSPAKPTTRRPLPMMQPAPAVTGDAAAIDPVCGMTVQPATAAGSYEYQGKTYYFCANELPHQVSGRSDSLSASY